MAPANLLTSLPGWLSLGRGCSTTPLSCYDPPSSQKANSSSLTTQGNGKSEKLGVKPRRWLKVLMPFADPNLTAPKPRVCCVLGPQGSCFVGCEGEVGCMSLRLGSSTTWARWAGGYSYESGLVKLVSQARGRGQASFLLGRPQGLLSERLFYLGGVRTTSPTPPPPG